MTKKLHTNPKNPTYVYVGAFVDELQRSGLRHAVICPGSRSTPLALNFAARSEIKSWMHVDERSAAFFALGLAKRSGTPVALICTSGTAAANFLPAIVEAHLTHVPLLILTADRPHELRDCGAPQAIDQNRIYGNYVKWFMDVALPEASNSALRYIRTLADRATALTTAVPPGPVHLNFPFREPLTPEALPDQPLPAPNQREALAWEGRPDHHPYVAVEDSNPGALSTETLVQLARRLRRIKRGLIVVGSHSNKELPLAILQLAHVLQYPLLVDPLSQMRSEEFEDELIISSYDAFLRLDTFSTEYEPELVIRFGAMPTAKSLLLYLKHHKGCQQMVVDGYSEWNEPTQLASHYLHTDPVLFCTQLRELLEKIGVSATTRSGDLHWADHWQKADEVTHQTLFSAIQDIQPLFEGRIFTELAELLPGKTNLYMGNSMPIRDLDTFFWSSQQQVKIIGNRGASGIDGVVSSALGFSAGSEPGERNVLVIGDLSFYHDLNGLLASKMHDLQLTIILINNDGGGIFSFLPQANYSEHFEQLFGTPTHLDFQPAVQMYGGQFQRISTWSEFRSALNKSLRTSGLSVIEVPTDRASNVSLHRTLWTQIEQALKQQGLIAVKRP